MFRIADRVSVLVYVALQGIAYARTVYVARSVVPKTRRKRVQRYRPIRRYSAYLSGGRFTYIERRKRC